MKRWAFRRGFNVYNLFLLAKKLGVMPSMEAAYGKHSAALGLVRRMALSFEDIDWERTKVYSFGNYGQLYVNVKGREPKGLVAAGAEYDALVDEVSRELLELRDPKRGNIMFDKVLPKKDLYRGPYADQAPDLVFLDSKMIYNAHRFFELASNLLVTPHPLYSGNHKMEGILIASGPSFAADGKPGTASILDVAPTVLALAGMRIPAYMDGGILKGLMVAEPPVAVKASQSPIGGRRGTADGVP